LAEDSQGDGAKRFRDHLRAAMDLLKKEPKDKAKILAALPGVCLAESRSETRLLIENLAAQCTSGLDAVVKTVTVLSFFVDGFTNREVPPDDAKYWADDLVEDGAIKENERDVLKSLIQTIQTEIVPGVKPKAMKQEAEGGVLPAFSGCGFTVEARSVRADFYRRGSSFEDYQSKILDQILDHAMIASFHIALDTGHPCDFYFQMGLDDIEYLIKMLTAAKLEMAAFEKYLGRSS